MKFLLNKTLLITCLLVTLLMVIGVWVVGHDALAIRQAEEVEEDTSKALLHAERWIDHQLEIEVALRDFVLFGKPQSVAVIEDNRQHSVEHIAGMQEVLGEYDEHASARLQGLVKFSERHQVLVAKVIADSRAADSAAAQRMLASQEYALFMSGAKLIVENLTRDLEERRRSSNSNVSLNVLRGSVSFAVLALGMISVLWVSYFITNRMQNENQELATRLAFESTHDALTGLPNRRYMQDHLGRAIDLAVRHKLHLGMMVIDLDGFKAINDTYGHGAGDRVLQEVASRLKTVSRTSDLVVRTGGDEFALFAENMEQVDSLQHLAQRLVDCLAEPMAIADQMAVRVGCSIGIAIYPEHANNIEALFAAADHAMYAAKESGNSCWRMPAVDG